jgi:hypothetical protein
MKTLQDLYLKENWRGDVLFEAAKYDFRVRLLGVRRIWIKMRCFLARVDDLVVKWLCRSNGAKMR